MYEGLQTASQTLQNQYWFMRKVYKDFDVHGSKHTIYCQANPQIWPKINDFGATLAQITCARDCRQLQNHYSVKTGSQARIINADVGILHDIVIQPQHFLPS